MFQRESDFSKFGRRNLQKFCVRVPMTRRLRYVGLLLT